MPTGRPGSATEEEEYRISFSRAEVVAIRHLSPVQHTTITATKGIKNALKDSGAAPALKSYYIKTAGLWLAQEEPSDRWTGVTAGVQLLLDWLERHLRAGQLPCFFWPAINLVSGLSPEKLGEMIATVQQMRRQAAPLLLACCEKRGVDLDYILEGGSEPLSEHQLRLRLARWLVRQAVMEGIRYRPAAPCWQYWVRVNIPTLAGPSEHRLLQWWYRHMSGTYRQQCCLLQALAVAPADLVGGVRLTSLGGDLFTWPVTPLLALLTGADMRALLGDPAAVAGWCGRQLGRPAGLTAGPDTPRGRAELLLRPELRLRALREAVPWWSDWWQGKDREEAEQWEANYKPAITYQQCRQLVELHLSPGHLEFCLHDDLPELSGAAAAATARSWRRRLEDLLAGDRLWAEYTARRARWPDRWRLRQYLVTDRPAQGETRHCTDTAAEASLVTDIQPAVEGLLVLEI